MRTFKTLAPFFIIFTFLLSCKKEMPFIPSKPGNENITPNLGRFFGNTWTQLTVPYISVIPPSTNMHNISFSVNNKVYALLLGYNQLWQYDPTSAAWSDWSNSFFPADMYASGYPTYYYAFTSGNNAYFLSPSTKSLREYSFSTFQWSSKANFPGTAQFGITTSFTTTDGYIMGGANGSDNNGYPITISENWQYDFGLDQWTAEAPTPGSARSNAASFAVGNSIYFGTGISMSFYFNIFTYTIYRFPITDADWYVYTPSTNTWVRKTDFAGGTRQDTRGFVINGAIYLGMGSSGYYTNLQADLWLYNPPTDTWVQRANYPPGNGYPPFNSMVGAGSNGYSVTESLGTFWQYTPYYTLF